MILQLPRFHVFTPFTKRRTSLKSVTERCGGGLRLAKLDLFLAVSGAASPKMRSRSFATYRSPRIFQFPASGPMKISYASFVRWKNAGRFSAPRQGLGPQSDNHVNSSNSINIAKAVHDQRGSGSLEGPLRHHVQLGQFRRD